MEAATSDVDEFSAWLFAPSSEPWLDNQGGMILTITVMTYNYYGGQCKVRSDGEEAAGGVLAGL